MNKYLHLTSLEMETMRVLMIHGKTYGLSIMHFLNKGREKHKIPEVGYGSFYPVLKKLEREKLLMRIINDFYQRAKHVIFKSFLK